jgi:hypothetical protein
VGQVRRDGRPGETSSGRLRRFHYNRLKQTPLRNPWISLRLSAANSWSGAVRSYMANEMIRQTIDFWTRTRMAPIVGHKPKRRD